MRVYGFISWQDLPLPFQSFPKVSLHRDTQRLHVLGAFLFRLGIYFRNLLYAQKAVYAIRFALSTARRSVRLGSLNVDNDCSLEHSRQITGSCFHQLYCNVIWLAGARIVRADETKPVQYPRPVMTSLDARRSLPCLFPQELAFP